MGSDEVHPKELQKLLAKIEDTPVEGLISRLTLRSMKQAKYSVECVGHFGLAARITVILLPRSAVIRICRSIELLKTVCVDG